MRAGDDAVRRTTRGEPQPAGTADKGAALVELAFALPLVLMLIVGMVSAGIAYNHQLSLTHSAREGGRYAATLPVTSFADLDAWLQEVITQVEADATGSLDPGVPGRYICVAYVFPDGTSSDDQTTRLILDSSGLGTPETGEDCFPPDGSIDDGRPSTERRVQVLVERDVDFDIVVFSTTLTLDSPAVSRFEAGLGF